MDNQDIGIGEKWLWTMKNGRTIAPEDMDTSHLQNSIHMLERAIASRPIEDAYGSPGPEDSDMVNDAFNAEVRHNNNLEEELRDAIDHLQEELNKR